MGHKVKPFKKGPDYIDAAWLGQACGNPASNLDPFFLDPPQLRGIFRHAFEEMNKEGGAGLDSIALIEGNRGLYDGLDATGAVSTAALARALDSPIILCLNCSKSTRTIAAILRGLLDFEEGLRFGGVVLNKIGSARHERALSDAIRMHTNLEILGALPRMESNPLPERHMGIASQGFELAENVEERLENIADFVDRHVDLGGVLKIACSTPPLPSDAGNDESMAALLKSSSKIFPTPRIGYVFDEALWFYYPENLLMLRNAGAEPVRLSLLDDSAENARAWENVQGLYLGGGFPEDFAESISRSPFMARIASAVNDGMPVYAECGGLLLLCKSLENDGYIWPMSGVFPARARRFPRPSGLGYVEAETLLENPFFPRGIKLKGHEFHYSDCEFPDTQPRFVFGLSRGKGLFCHKNRAYDGMIKNKTIAAYTHIFAPAIPCWAKNFSKAAVNFMSAKQNL